MGVYDGAANEKYSESRLEFFSLARTANVSQGRMTCRRLSAAESILEIPCSECLRSFPKANADGGISDIIDSHRVFAVPLDALLLALLGFSFFFQWT